MKLQNDLQNRKQMYINTVRDYLNSKHIIYNEYETPTGSHYFHLNLNNQSSPCIRISNHKKLKNSTHCLTLLYNLGLNTNREKTIQKIQRTLKNTIKNSYRYSVWRTFEQIKKYGEI